MPNLNLDHFCSIFAQVCSREFGDELLHYQAALVLNEEGLDPLLLIPAEFVSESQKLGDGFFDRRIQIMVGVELQEWALLVKLLAFFRLELFKALVQELQQHEDAVGVHEEL